jgi:hypothetical protein
LALLGVVVKNIFVGILLLVSSVASATLVESENYSNNVNNNYWTNIDLGLDVLRLDWVDTLGSSNQANLNDFESFIDDTNGVWRFATWSEFRGLVNWFDTDPSTNGWSMAQNIGGNLFFQLNGYGPDHTDQYGFDHEGYTYWQFGTYNDENELEFVWFADFGDQDDRVVCVSWSVLCLQSYFPDENTPMFTASYAISMAGINVAPILVRDISNKNLQQTATQVPEPSMSMLLLGGLFLFAVRRKK